MSNSNSILFDFYSLIDMELSLIEFIKNEYRDIELKYLDKNKIITNDRNSWLFQRQFGPEDLFESLILDNQLKSNSKEIFKQIISDNEKEILEKYAQKTDVSVLINAYKQTGNGIIKCYIQCENEWQKDCISRLFPGTEIVQSNRSSIDLSRYGRIVIGDYISGLEYNPESPISVLVASYRENFEKNDSTRLRPELIIKFGDIHEVNVISVYRPDSASNMEGEN